MHSIAVKKMFDAAHRLADHPGRCSRLHGHSWEVEAVFEGETGDDGMVLDFEVAGRALARALESFDHTYLNEVEPFDTLPPTAENVARVLFEKLGADLATAAETGAVLVEVTVWESRENRATFRSG